MQSILLSLFMLLTVQTGDAPAGGGASDDDGSKQFTVTLSSDGLLMGAANERELAAKVAEKADFLIAAAQDHEQNNRLRLAFDGYLAAANWILAYQIEPMASREILRSPQPDDADAALGFVNRARAQLARAATIWKSIENDEKLVDTDERFALADQLESLQGFANAFWALWRTDYASDSQRDEALAQAAGRLSIAREDERPQVAQAAQLWQAYLYFVRGRNERTIDLLPDAMTSPNEAIRYEFFARVLRCRALVRDGRGYSSAIALLSRMEHNVTEWFPQAGTRREAQRVAALARRQVLSDWATQFRQSAEPDRAKWCDEAIADIDREYFSSLGSAPVLRLDTAAPKITKIPFESDADAQDGSSDDADAVSPPAPEGDGE